MHVSSFGSHISLFSPGYSAISIQSSIKKKVSKCWLPISISELGIKGSSNVDINEINYFNHTILANHSIDQLQSHWHSSIEFNIQHLPVISICVLLCV